MTDLSTTFAAVAFAEANEHETAKRMLADKKPSSGGGNGSKHILVLVLGVASALLYLGLYLYRAEILELSAKGHWYFVVPVTIAFVFSFVHGAFTGELWTAVGLVAKK